ncbi:U32 family peptidase [Vibrio chagasii]|nr:U32 family peptidase [Vibrio chagasii]
MNELNEDNHLAHEYGCSRIFLTLNVVLLEHETKSITKLLNQLVNTKVDGIIGQDLGLFNLVKKHFPSLNIALRSANHTTKVRLSSCLRLAHRALTSRELNLHKLNTDRSRTTMMY